MNDTEEKYNEINDEISRINNIQIAKQRIIDIRNDDSNMPMQSIKFTPKRKLLHKNKSNKKQSSSPKIKGGKFKAHYNSHNPRNSSSFENRDRNHKERISKLKAKDFVPPENQNRIRIVTKRQRPSKTMKPSINRESVKNLKSKHMYENQKDINFENEYRKRICKNLEKDIINDEDDRRILATGLELK